MALITVANPAWQCGKPGVEQHRQMAEVATMALGLHGLQQTAAASPAWR